MKTKSRQNSAFVFMDNYRGFSDTLIQLGDVNFLVGENSTGKTSLLALIELLSSAEFYFSHRFKTPDINLGGFSDILSANSKSNRFSVGWAKISTSRSGTGQAFLATYRNQDGQCQLANCTLTMHNHVVRLSLRDKAILYSIRPLPRDARTSPRFLHTWCSNHQLRITRSKKLPTSLSQAPLPIILAYLNSLLRTKPGDRTPDPKVDFSIHIPELFPNRVVGFSPIRTRPRRTYDENITDFSPEGTHTPYVLRRLLKEKGDSPEFQEVLRKFGEESGLFRSIRPKEFIDSGPFELRIRLHRQLLQINNVGYGVSQVLPLVVEILASHRGTCFVIQQPEVHLHPRAQAATGELIFESASNQEKRFFIETHSDFLIDRFRTRCRESQPRPLRSQILFLERRQAKNIIHQIHLDESGGLPDALPTKYRDFFLREDMRLLGF